MRCVFLDFETYYEDKTYSLKNMSIEEYVRHPKFKVHLLCYAVNNEPVAGVPVGRILDCLRVLRLDSPDTLTVIQNAKFDAFILTHYYGINVANPVCSRAMFRWCGGSSIACESLAAQSEFFQTGQKGDFLKNMSGRTLHDLSVSELEAYMSYCGQDVTLLRENVKRMLPYMTAEALAFNILTTKMYTHPVLQIDTEKLALYLKDLQQTRLDNLAELRAKFGFTSQTEFGKALRSKAQFSALIEQAGGIVPMKLSEKKTATARKKYGDEAEEVWEPALAKTDAGFMALCESDNPVVAALANARKDFNSSIEESRAQTLLAIGERGALPVPLEAFQAITGRYTGGGVDTAIKSDGVNLQNLPKRTGNTTLRQCIKAPDGYVIVAGDSSQVEARVGAWLAGAEGLLNDFRSGRDPYVSMASEIYHVDYGTLLAGVKDDKHPDHKQYKFYRQIGKTCVLQLQYGSGYKKLAEYLSQQKISLGEGDAHVAECQRVVNVYRTVHKAIPKFWDTCDNVLRLLVDGREQRGTFGGPHGDTFFFNNQHKVFDVTVPGVKFPDGFWLRYPGLRGENDGYYYNLRDHGKTVKKHLYSAALMNNLTQGLAFAIMRWQALQINSFYPIIANIHDSWGSLVPENKVEHALEVYKYWMSQVPDWAAGVPIACEVKQGTDFTVV